MQDDLWTKVWRIDTKDSFTRCGFVREGVLRSHRQRYGEPIDMVLFGILRDEFL